jgi:hypothetical protein
MADATTTAETCPHCGATNSVRTCSRDGKRFVVSAGHRREGLREFEDEPLAPLPADFEPPELCDFCRLKAAGKPAEAVIAGLRQKTCAACRKQFI